MAAPPEPDSLSLEQLLEAVARLSPAKMREFERRKAERRSDQGNDGPDEATLVRAARARLTAAAERRLKRLIGRSERGRLTRDELAEYQALAQEVQRLDAARAEATAELARRRGKSVRAVKAENWFPRRHGWRLRRSRSRYGGRCATAWQLLRILPTSRSLFVRPLRLRAHPASRTRCGEHGRRAGMGVPGV